MYDYPVENCQIVQGCRETLQTLVDDVTKNLLSWVAHGWLNTMKYLENLAFVNNHENNFNLFLNVFIR